MTKIDAGEKVLGGGGERERQAERGMGSGRSRRERSQVELTMSAMLMSSLMLHLYPVKAGAECRVCLPHQNGVAIQSVSFQ